MTLLSDSTLVMIGVCLVAILSMFILWRLYIRKHNSVAAKLEQSLQEISKDHVTSIIIPDGIGGLIEVEHLILTDRGFLVIETYPLTGNLFGSENIDQWTQIIDGRSYKFSNPSRHIEHIEFALQALAPKIQIFTRVVFTSDGHFPKGVPEGVSSLASLHDDLKFIQHLPNMEQQVQSMWERILRIARKNGQAVNRDTGI